MESILKVRRLYERGWTPSVRQLMMKSVALGHPVEALLWPLAVVVCRWPIWVKNIAVKIGLIAQDFDWRAEEVSTNDGTLR